ncbi:hypothetical protein RF55_13738, partial [Lasius niger]
MLGSPRQGGSGSSAVVGNRPRGRITLTKSTSKAYGMDTKKEKDVPAQGDGPPRARQSGNIVPVPAGSLSDDGPAVESEESSAVALVIASTSDVPSRRIVDPSVGGLPDGSALQPVVRLSRVNVSPVLGSPGTSGRSFGQQVLLCGPFGSPPGADETVSSARVSSAVVISDDEQASNPSAKRESAKVTSGRVSKPPRRRRGRPNTTGEWVGITEAMERYNAARAVELELDEIEYILDSKTLPKKTKGKQDLPSIDDLRRDLSDYSYEAIRKKSGESLLDKLSDKSFGLNGKLVHEMRMASRRLVASVVELSDRAERHELEVLKRNRGNEYLIKDIDRLRGELEIARIEIVSLRSSVSPSGRSPPHKKAKGLDDLETREIGTQMDLDEVSLDPVSAPLPVSPIIERVMADKCCSPVWSAETPVFPAPAGTPCGGESGASPLGSRDLTALEQSLLDHIEALFAQRNSLQENLGRIRREMEDTPKDSTPSALEEKLGESRTTAKTKRKRSRKKGRVSHTGDHSCPPLPPSDGVGAASLPCAGPSAASPVLGDGQWSQVTGRRARCAARTATALKDGPSAPLGHGTTSGPGKSVMGGGVAASRSARGDPSSEKKLKGRRELGLRLRPPTTAVVSVTIKPGSGLGYREIMAEARSKINLNELGIANSRIKQAVNGGVLIQIPGKDRVKLADDLANRMDEVLKGKGASIGRPSKLAELRVRGIDIFVTPDNVASAIALAGRCDKNTVRLGRIRKTASGLGTVWVRCPALAAKRVVSMGRVRLGWGFASVELLPPPPVDDKTGKNLPQQGYLGAPAADVAGTIVPGAPTSLSNEGLAEVLEAGTLDIDTGYKAIALSGEGLKDSFDLEGDTFFGDSPPTGHHQKGNVEMEVDQESSKKKRKAEVSLVVGSSSEDEIITPSNLSRRRRRGKRLVDPSPEKGSITDHIYLTADYETPHGSDYTDVESVGKAASTGNDVKGARGGAVSRVKFSTPKKGKKSAIFGSKIDFKPDLDSISPNQLLGMSATNAGLVGLECVEKAESSGDPSLLEARVRELSDELLATKKESNKERIELDKLKAENETLRKEIVGMKTELRKLDKIENENDDLWKVVKELKAELLSLKKGGATTERSGNIRGKAPGFLEGPPSSGDTSAMAVSSGIRAIGTFRDAPDTKKTTDEQIEHPRREVRKDESGAAAPVAMEWERLPQRSPRPSRLRVVTNVQLVPPRGSGSATKKRRVSNRENIEEPKEGPKPDKATDRNTFSSKGGDGKAKGSIESGAPKRRRDFKPTLSRGAETNPRRKSKGPVPPRTVAVSITSRSEGFSYKDALIKARNEISLNDLKIEST